MPVTTSRVAGPPADRRRTIGALVAFAAVAIVALLVAKPDPFATHRDVRARFADVAALGLGRAEVRVAGVKVGEVSGRRRVGDAAELTLQLDGDAPALHADARATLRPALLFEGKAYVDLAPGHAAAPLGAAGIPLRQTGASVQLADALTVLDRPRAADLRAIARDARTTLAPAPARALGATLGRAPGLTAQLGRTARAARGPHAIELRAAVAHLAATSAAVATRQADLVPVARAAARTADALAPAATAPAPLDTALARLPATVARVRTGAAALGGTVAHARVLAREAQPALRAAAPLLHDARPVLRRAAPTLRAATPLVTRLAATLAAAQAVSAPARRILGDVDGADRTLEGSLLAALEQPTSLGTPAYLAFLGLFAGGGGASAPYGVQGTGHLMRFGLRFLTGAGQPLPPCTLLEKVNPTLGAAAGRAGACTP